MTRLTRLLHQAKDQIINLKQAPTPAFAVGMPWKKERGLRGKLAQKDVKCSRKHFLYAVDPESSLDVGMRWPIRDGMSQTEYDRLWRKCEELVGDDFVIFDSLERPEFLAKR